jgi:hypothetical protein
MRYRVPPELEDTDAGEMADEALETIVDVMRQRVHPLYAPTVLKAASMIREEVCGPVVKKFEVKMGLAELLAAATDDRDDEQLPSLEVKTLGPATLHSVDLSTESQKEEAAPEGAAPEPATAD